MNYLEHLKCPACQNILLIESTAFRCSSCGKEYFSEDGIPVIFRNETLRDSILKDWETVAKSFNPDNVHTGRDTKRYNIRIWKANSALGKLVRNKASFILDIGCGAGKNIYLLKQQGYSNIVGTEFSLERIRLAREINESHAFISSDCLPFLPGTFDTVISTAVIEHVENQDEFIKEVSQVLKPGGIAVITSDCYIYRFYEKIGAYITDQPIDKAPQPFALLKKFKEHHFEVLHYDGFTFIRFLFIKSLLKAIFRLIIGHKKFMAMKDERKKHREMVQQPENLGNYSSTSQPEIKFSKSLLNLWRVFFSQQNIFVVKKQPGGAS